MEDLLKTEDVAKALNIKGVTLRGYRVKGKGPKFVKLGRAIRYHPYPTQHPPVHSGDGS